MLSDEALDLSRQRISLELRERATVFGRELAQVRATATMNGTNGGSRLVLEGRRLIRLEYEIRYLIAWQIFARLIDASRSPASRELGTQAKQEVRLLVHNASNDLREADTRLLSVGGDWPDHQSLCVPAMDRVESEINMTMFAARQGQRLSGESTVNIYNPIGIVQTGPASSATLTQYIDATGKQAIAHALQQLRVQLESSDELSNSARAEVLAVIADAEGEARSNQPNVTRLRGAIAGIATTIQTLGSASEAYKVLRGAASLIGLHLP